MMKSPFEAALSKANSVFIGKLGNASIAVGTDMYRGILDYPLTVKELENDAGEIADSDFSLSMISSDVEKAQITKRTKLSITLDSGDELKLYVIRHPEKGWRRHE